MIETADLPVNWTSVELSEVGEWGSGGTPTRKNPAYYGGSIPWLKIGDLTDGPVDEAEVHITDDGLNASAAKLLPPDTLLLAMYGSIGKLGITRIPCATNQAIAFCNPKQRIVDLKYLFFQLRYLRPHLVSLGQGGTQQNISQTILKRMQIALAPQQEQHRIVEMIETLFARINKGEEALREVQKLIKRYRQSILKAAVTGELTRDWREANQRKLEPASDLLARILETRRKKWQGRGKYKEPAQVEATCGIPRPKGWICVSVDHLLREGLSNGRSVRSSERGFPVLTLTALKNGHIDLAERKIGDWTQSEAAPYCIQEGDVLASRGNGSKHLVGRAGLVRDKPDPVAFPDTMIRIPLNLTCTNPEWFIHLWNSPFMRAQIESCAKTTAGIYKINQSDIRSFKVPLPPIPEQREISAKIDELVTQVSNLETVCDKEMARSISLRQSILKSAFTGQLVPQDPNDEPASELLARIRAERKATPRAKSRRKASA